MSSAPDRPAGGTASESAHLAQVVLVPAPGRLAPLTYRVPAALGPVAPGCRVLVPLGSRRSMGVVLAIGADAPARNDAEREPVPSPPQAPLRDVIAALDREPVLDAALRALVCWMAEYYLAPLGDAFATALPGVLQVETERVAVWAGEYGERPALSAFDRGVADAIGGAGEIALLALRSRFGVRGTTAVQRLQRRGIIRVEERLRRERAPTRLLRSYEAVPHAEADARLARRPALRALYAYLRDHPLRRAPAHELRHTFPAATAKLRALAESGLVRMREEETYRSVLPPIGARDQAPPLTAAQQAVVDAVLGALGAGFVPWLLRGVTGSGKTEVYLRAIAGARAAGRGALLLVPEISLTHQLVERVRARFGDTVAVLHSQLGVGERWDEWRRLARGEAQIALGARSAVFAPVRDLGLIVVDEEHDPAYKQADGVHYQGRDVAVMRAKLAACTLLLGSATPSMESIANARWGRYRLLELPERIEARPLPPVRMVDLRTPRHQVEPLSPELRAAVAANLMAGGQTLLFLNRRGFANFLQCRACGDPLMCPNCSVTLTFHRTWRAVRCHYCDYTAVPPAACAGCAEPALEAWGIGTEQLEAILREHFPRARIARMDRDTTRRKGTQRALLSTWSAGGLDILIGTQMITKGHDVAGVTLVGVVHADASLNFPDFRAAERTFQLLAQVAGRAGRGDRPGRVVVQTLQPDHYSLRAAAAHDFGAFAEAELAVRREADYPPFIRLVLVRIEGTAMADVERIAQHAARQLRETAASRWSVLGPAPAPLERLRQRYRRLVLLRSRQGSVLRRGVAAALPDLRAAARGSDVRIIVDVDPYSML